MSTRPIIKRETLVSMINVPGEFVAYRGMMVCLAVNADQKGIIFELYDKPEPTIHVAWFNGSGQRVKADEFSRRCRLTGVTV